MTPHRGSFYCPRPSCRAWLLSRRPAWAAASGGAGRRILSGRTAVALVACRAPSPRQRRQWRRGWHRCRLSRWWRRMTCSPPQQARGSMTVVNSAFGSASYPPHSSSCLTLFLCHSSPHHHHHHHLPPQLPFLIAGDLLAIMERAATPAKLLHVWRAQHRQNSAPSCPPPLQATCWPSWSVPPAARRGWRPA